jgi:hypothetical protein
MSLMVGCVAAEPYLVASWCDTMNSLNKSKLNMKEKKIILNVW